MKKLLMLLLPLCVLNSCVFDAPFNSTAMFPVNPKWLGRWEEVPDQAGAKAEQMVVIQYSDNEYVVEYPAGKSALFFRGYGVRLADKDYIQIQWIGNAEKPLATADRKYHLVKVDVTGDAMEMRVLKPDSLGEKPTTTAALTAAFAKHKDDPELFDKPAKFKRIKQP